MTDGATSHRLNLVTVAAACALLHAFRSVLAPFALALVLAVLIDGLMGVLSRRLPSRLERAAGPIAALLVGGGTAACAAVLVDGAIRVVAAAPRLLGAARTALKGLPGAGEAGALAAGALDRLDLAALASRSAEAVQGAAAGAGLTGLFLAFILACRPLIRAKLTAIARNDGAGRGFALLQRSVRAVETYAWNQTATGLVLAAAAWAVMAAVGLEDAPFWAVLAFLLGYLPFIGVALASLAPAAFALLQFGDPAPALIVFVSIQIAAFLVGNLMLPRLQAHDQNLDPAMSMAAVGVWTVLWGAPGAVLAVPLTVALMVHLAQHERLRWLAILISNDGGPRADPLAPDEPSPTPPAMPLIPRAPQDPAIG